MPRTARTTSITPIRCRWDNSQMKYETPCECGKALAVSAADAGSTLRCACGRNVDVPPLHMLRTKGGDAAIPHINQVRAMLRSGALPGTRACAVCGTETDSRCRVKVVCERVVSDPGPAQAQAAGCLLFSLMMALFGVGVLVHHTAVEDEEAVIVPLPVCEACRPKLNNVSELVKALRKIPDYAALLDRYREAEVTLVG